jgi:uncharacterized protein (TIGR03435 family)
MRRLSACGIGLLAAAASAYLLVGLLQPPRVSAQSTDAASDWEKAAGGKMSFDVASIKQDTSGNFFPPKFALDQGDTYPGNTTLFTSGFPLSTDISFAYKLGPFEDQALRSQLPKWAQTETFDIEAKAAAPSTKDQMRLMVQSLLEERFNLKVHFETKDRPVFALVLANPGKTGPQLRPYAADPPCTNEMPPGPIKMGPGELPPLCHALMLFPSTENGVTVLTWTSRNISMRQIANDIPAAPTANLDRPVVDQTGLSGDFDFVMTYAAKSPVATDAAPTDAAPTFLEALKDQLGLKLQSATAPVTTLVVDHIEEPSPN